MRPLLWSLVIAVAVGVDIQSPEAALYLSRCLNDDWQAAGVRLLRLDQHAAAFPWSFVVMAGMCVPPWRAGTPRITAGVRRLIIMLMAMPASCGLAWLLARQVPLDWQAASYATTMLGSTAVLMSIAWLSSVGHLFLRQKSNPASAGTAKAPDRLGADLRGRR